MRLSFYSRKEKRLESIELEWQPHGWRIRHGGGEVNTTPDGLPHLYECITRHATPVPAALADALEELWEAVHRGVLGPEHLQARLEGFSAWLQAYEKNPAQDFRDFLLD